MQAQEPKQFIKHDTQKKIHFVIIPTFLGHILAAESNRGLCSVILGDTPEELEQDLMVLFPKTQLIEENREKLASTIHLLLQPPFLLPANIPLDLQGTDFQREVWKIVQTTPPGHTTTYSAVAQKLGKLTSVRAVANAIAANRLALVIPCHRVIRKDGSLCGYRWGMGRKKKLLELESYYQLSPLPAQ